MSILIISRNPNTASVVANEICQAGGSCYAIESLRELGNHDPFQGVVIDLHTLVNFSAADRQTLQALGGTVPVAKIRLDGTRDHVAGVLVTGKRTGDCRTIEEFVRLECPQHQARRARQKERIEAHYPVTLVGAKKEEKTFTLNVSPNGAFVATVQELEKGDPVTLKTAVGDFPATVCWSRPWGLFGAVPGVGIHFDQPVPWDKVRAAGTN